MHHRRYQAACSPAETPIYGGTPIECASLMESDRAYVTHPDKKKSGAIDTREGNAIHYNAGAQRCTATIKVQHAQQVTSGRFSCIVLALFPTCCAFSPPRRLPLATCAGPATVHFDPFVWRNSVLLRSLPVRFYTLSCCWSLFSPFCFSSSAG